MESESGKTNTKISDSGYSNSCSNSNSQRSASSKSRHSESNSSRSSGYCGTNQNGVVETGPQPPKRNKEKEHKKKKLKLSNTTSNSPTVVTVNAASQPESTRNITSMETNSEEMVVETLPNPINSSTNVQEVANISKIEMSGNAATIVASADTPPPEEEMPIWHGMPSLEDSLEDVVDENLENEERKSNSKEAPSQPEDGFCCVISMYDGVVQYTTPSLTAALGFPKDMWIGRSFIDFVHPKDRETFSNQITTNVALPFVESQESIKEIRNSLYVCLRRYRGLKSSGFGVVDKNISYQSFQLNVTFRCMPPKTNESNNFEKNGGMFIIVVAVPVKSSYKVPDERTKSAKFGMRHTATCIFSHVDPDIVTSFGFLPQDMLGKSVFDFYHPDDMPFLKEVYESVMGMCQVTGSVFRSKPYRFAVQNGGFAMIETEWSSFVNPWSRRLEFVIGLHRVLQGPSNPNIFDTPNSDEIKHISEEVLKESKIIQEEILMILNQEIPNASESAKQEASKKCRDLADFMESLMAEVYKSNLHLDLLQDPDPTISERDSVMLGEISPHHDYYDSKSSSETPPSYNQLNYNENIQRFFESKPKTTVSDESGERAAVLQSSNSNDTEQERKSLNGLTQDCSNNQKCLSPIQNSGASGSGSAGNLSSGSNPNIESGTTSGTNTSTNDPYNPPQLTEALLLKHNEEMEKCMIKQYREHRCSTKEREHKKHHADKGYLDDKNNIFGCGMKRSMSYSWDKDDHKVTKHKHICADPSHILNDQSARAANNVENFRMETVPCNDNLYQQSSMLNDVNLWPPFSVTMTPVNNTSVNINTTSVANGFTTGMFPVYYLPNGHQKTMPDNADPNTISPSNKYQIQYMPGMIYNYNPIFPASPLLCPHMPVFPVSFVQQISATPEQEPTSNMEVSLASRQPIAGKTGQEKETPAIKAQLQRPCSQATSVKAEPGSAMGSIASASVVNKALSECSRKDIGLQSVCSPDSPIVSPPDCETEGENYLINLKMEKKNYIWQHVEKKTENETYRESRAVDEESNFSSTYSSFLKTENGSGSNDCYNNSKRSDDNNWKQFPARKRNPPWLESVSVTSDLIFRYHLNINNVEDILQADLKTLETLKQPSLVNDQLNQLYLEMELEGVSTKLSIEEGFTSSGSSSDETYANTQKARKKGRPYSSLVMIYEENAPFPPPEH